MATPQISNLNATTRGDISFLAILANLPMWRGFMARGGRISQFAALPLLRLAPLEILAE
jgi:hypothetical protein